MAIRTLMAEVQIYVSDQADLGSIISSLPNGKRTLKTINKRAINFAEHIKCTSMCIRNIFTHRLYSSKGMIALVCRRRTNKSEKM